MGALIHLGDVPGWIQGIAETAALYMAVRDRRQQQAIAWVELLRELSGLQPEELRRGG